MLVRLWEFPYQENNRFPVFKFVESLVSYADNQEIVNDIRNMIDKMATCLNFSQEDINSMRTEIQNEIAQKKNETSHEVTSLAYLLVEITPSSGHQQKNNSANGQNTGSNF